MAILRPIDPELGPEESPAHLAVVRDDDPGEGDRPVATQRITLVIPTLNEERNIAWVVGRVPSIVDEVLIVDGRSRDRTIEVAKAVRPDIGVVEETLPGKGAALRKAFEAATGDIIVMLDADCSMDPLEIPAFVEAIEDGADLAKGSRFLEGGGSSDISRLRRLGNRALLGMTNQLYGARHTELCYGYMAFRRTCLPQLGLRSTGFEIETEIVVRALKAGLRIAEVPSYESQRRYGESHLRTFRDGWRVARTVIRERLRPELEMLLDVVEREVVLEPAERGLVPVSMQEPESSPEA
jgi:glycosyltransferase involved in cell wall biosynthesis